MSVTQDRGESGTRVRTGRPPAKPSRSRTLAVPPSAHPSSSSHTRGSLGPFGTEGASYDCRESLRLFLRPSRRVSPTGLHKRLKPLAARAHTPPPPAPRRRRGDPLQGLLRPQQDALAPRPCTVSVFPSAGELAGLALLTVLAPFLSRGAGLPGCCSPSPPTQRLRLGSATPGAGARLRTGVATAPSRRNGTDVGLQVLRRQQSEAPFAGPGLER